MFQLVVCKTPSGPVVTLNINLTEVVDLCIPTIAVNPFGMNGWEYVQSIFETSAFCWMISDGGDTAVFFASSSWHADMAAQACQASLGSLKSVEKRNFEAALKHMQT